MPCRTKSHAVILPVWRTIARRNSHLEELRLDRCNYAFGNFVLNGEHVGHREVVAFDPQMRAVAGIDQLRRYAQPLAGMAHIAVQRVARAELIGGLISERESRAADDNAKPAISARAP